MAREGQALNGATKGTDMENEQYPQEQDTDPDQLRLAKLGAFGIMGESIKCYSKQARFFSCILFTLGIPLLLFTIVDEILSPKLLIRHPSMSSQVAAQSSSQRRLSPPGIKTTSATGDHGELANQIIRLWNLFLEGNPHVWSKLYRKAIPVLGLSLGASVLNLACQALWDSGTVYTVGLIYCRASLLRESSVVPFFGHVLRTIPSLLCRVMRTWLWSFSFMMILCIILVVSQVVIFCLPLSLEAALLPSAILWLFVLTCLLGIGTLGDVAGTVTILDPEESSYGLEAFKKARALLKGKWKVAILLEFILLVITLSIYLFIQPHPFTANRWNQIRILVIIITCVAIWGVNQVRGISLGVLYLSLKAFHEVSTTGLQTEERTKGLFISSPSCATDATGAYGRAEKQATGTDHRYSLLPV